MSDELLYLIDGQASYLEGFDAEKLRGIDEQVDRLKRSVHWDKHRVIPTEWCGPEENRFVPTAWNGTKSEASEEKRLAGLKVSWDNEGRRKAASSRMKDARKTMKQNYTDERNAKVSEGMKKVWERRKLEKAFLTKENI